ncbi:MAG: ArsR/SmtB family transcription factor [Planctomycetota bacterium]|jgi:DNA-binding transcriptional ArsR family regulator
MDQLTPFLAVHRALADRSRVRALNLLTHGELCLCELIQVLGLAPSTVSKHMTELSTAGLVVRRKEGRWQFYRLPAKGASAHVRESVRLLRRLQKDPQLESDVKMLRKVKQMEPGQVTGCY